MESIKGLAELISQLGFPIVISMWLMFIHFGILKQNLVVITELKAVIKNLDDTLKTLVIRVDSLEEKVLENRIDYTDRGGLRL